MVTYRKTFEEGRFKIVKITQKLITTFPHKWPESSSNKKKRDLREKNTEWSLTPSFIYSQI